MKQVEEIDELEIRETLDEEEIRLSRWVHEGFDFVGGPSEHLLARIDFAARSAIRRRQLFRLASRMAAVAAIAVLVFGGLFWSIRRPALSKSLAKTIVKGHEASEQLTTFVLANQGLDRDSYFAEDETDSLWL